jgi:two-component system, response regulator RegA
MPRYVRVILISQPIDASRKSNVLTIDVHQTEGWKRALAFFRELRPLTDACSMPHLKEEPRGMAMMNPRPRNFADRPSLLLVDRDIASCKVLAGALATRGFQVQFACSAEQAARLVNEDPPQHAVIALDLPDYSGLKLVSKLLAFDPDTRIVVLTAYPSIRTAVEAIKLGATYYLAKPASPDEVVAAFYRDRGDESIAVRKKPMSVRRAEWEYISSVMRDHDGNISATARALSMHRRTLQRKLRKRPPRD